jgi:hypothetical protein
MSQEFLPDPNEAPTPAISSNFPTEPRPTREHIKVMLPTAPRPTREHIIGSPNGVNSTIRHLYSLRFAEVTAWSPLQPTSTPGEVMSVLRHSIPRD